MELERLKGEKSVADNIMATDRNFTKVKLDVEEVKTQSNDAATGLVNTPVPGSGPLATVAIINDYYDNASEGLANNTKYKRSVGHAVVHPILGGGAWLLEGYKVSGLYQIQLTSSYSHVGTKIFERSKFNGTWTPWKRIATTDKGQNFTATLQNGWTGSLAYSKNDLGQVWVRGNIGVGTFAFGTTIGTIPTSHRPNFPVGLSTYNITSGKTIVGITLLNTGEIKVYSPSSEDGTLAAGHQLSVNILIQT